MAPVKFGLFKGRSREQEQPSTENLLHSSSSSDQVMAPNSPIPSTSHGVTEQLSPADITALQLDSDDEDKRRGPQKNQGHRHSTNITNQSGSGQIMSENITSPSTRRISDSSQTEQGRVNYHPLLNPTSIDATSTSTLQDDDFNHIGYSDETIDPDYDGASTSCDANSLQFDETSLAASEDTSVYCGNLKKGKKNKNKMDKQLSDFVMWQASNIEVMKNLLSRSGTVDQQIKWEAIATARGLCTLTDSCACGDCVRAKYLTGVTDGDGGLGAAPLFSAISVGCTLQ